MMEKIKVSLSEEKKNYKYLFFQYCELIKIYRYLQ